MDWQELFKRLDRIAAALEDLADERTKDRRWIASLSDKERDYVMSMHRRGNDHE